MGVLIRYTKKYAPKYGHATGALILKDGKILAKAVTTVEKDKNPTSHAELKAISRACKKIKNYHLTGCYLYTTQEPCPMCASAIVWSRLKGVIYGWEGRNGWGRLNIKPEKIFATSPQKIRLWKRHMVKECLALKEISGDGKG